MQRNDSHATALRFSATRFDYDGNAVVVEREVPVELPVNIVISPVSYAVMMLTPRDVEDFATGFCLTEGIVDCVADIRDIRVEDVQGGCRVEITLSSEKLQRHLARTRNLSGRTGCGVCGISDLAALPMAQHATTPRIALETDAIQRAMSGLVARQDLHRRTRGTHAAAWCDLSGEVKFLREDVGRHNALDKLIGALMRDEVAPDAGFVVITSRCSFEMVEKAAAFGVSALVAVSAPTSLAVERAVHHDMLLLAAARENAVLCFSHPERINAHAQSGRRRA